MRTLTTVFVAAAIAVTSLPAARAHDNSQVTAPCSLNEDPVGQPQYGTLAGYAATDTPGAGTFTCYLVDDGVVIGTTPGFHGEHVFVAAGRVDWTFGSRYGVDLCARIVWDDGHPPYERCQQAYTSIPLPSSNPLDLADLAVATLDGAVLTPVGSAACTALGEVAPGVSGIVGCEPYGGDEQVTARCRLSSLDNELTRGQNVPTYLLEGTAVTTTGGGGEFRCYVLVDGSDVASVPARHGNRVFSTAGQVTFTNSETQVVETCAEIVWDDGHPAYRTCEVVTSTQLPSLGTDLVDELVGLLNDAVVIPLVDPVACAVLRGLAPGVPGVVDIDPTGDTSLAGVPFWDCPPYAS